MTPASSILCTKCIPALKAYKAGCTTDASAARMCGGVAAATGNSGTGEGPVEKVPLPHGGEMGAAGAWPPQGTLVPYERFSSNLHRSELVISSAQIAVIATYLSH